MHHSNTLDVRNALIIGCGFLGKELAKVLLARGVTVWGTVRRPDAADDLRAMGVNTLVLSVTEPESFGALRPVIEAGPLDAFYLVPPGRGGGGVAADGVVRLGVAHAIAALRAGELRCALLASSTSIYGDGDVGVVDADTPAHPTTERARRQAEAESRWLEGVPRARVVRLAGLYGPGRVVGAERLLKGESIAKDPYGYLNLIHVEDAASLLAAVAGSQTAERVELGCDDHPVTRKTYYGWLAKQLGCGPPVFRYSPSRNTNNPAVSPSKCCSNRVTCTRTGWRPRYPSYREGVLHALRATRDQTV